MQKIHNFKIFYRNLVCFKQFPLKIKKIVVAMNELGNEKKKSQGP